MNKYQLHVKEGYYAADNLFALLWLVFKHRLYHLIKERKWRD